MPHIYPQLMIDIKSGLDESFIDLPSSDGVTI